MNDLIRRKDVIEVITGLPAKVDDLGCMWMIDILKQIKDIPSVELKERTKVNIRYRDESVIFGYCECGQAVNTFDIYCRKCGKRLNWSDDE